MSKKGKIQNRNHKSGYNYYTDHTEYNSKLSHQNSKTLFKQRYEIDKNKCQPDRNKKHVVYNNLYCCQTNSNKPQNVCLFEGTQSNSSLTLTPKITDTHTNVVGIETYRPQRHHLDDTQMKKVMRDPYPIIKRCSSLKPKTVYVYDGTKIAYQKPIQKKLGKNNQLNQVWTQYDQNETVPIKEIYVERPKIMYRNQSMNTQNRYFSKPMEKQLKSCQFIITKPKIVNKNAIVQCSINRFKIKDPFRLDLNSETDSNFSGFELDYI